MIRQAEHISPGRSQALVIRTPAADPYTLVPAVRAALREMDPQLALSDVKTLADQVSRSLWRQRLQGQVLGIFAALVCAPINERPLVRAEPALATR